MRVRGEGYGKSEGAPPGKLCQGKKGGYGKGDGNGEEGEGKW